MQVGVVWTINAKSLSIDNAVANANELCEEGFRRVWTTQMPNEPDALTVIGVVGREVPDIEFGTSVLPIQSQHPMKLAQQAATVNQILGGRLTLGLGLSHKVVTEGMWGVPYGKPVQRTEEYLDGLLPLLNGEKASAAGELVTTRGSLTLQAPAPSVYFAALGPKMLNVAGRRTSGTVTWMTGPKTLRDHVIPTLRQAAADAGRPDGAVRTVAMLPVCVTDDVDAARAEAGRQFAMYDGLPSYKAMLDREGFTGPADAAIVGDEATVADRLAELAAFGVDEYVGILFDRDPEVRARTRALLRTLDE
ncbi:TIGR03564 family F420-dependent LLM class oxidoreductase [Gordonia sp. HY285]|uniref:TIGR03564 family F420-dependent LLM class oxidoreductase n=1 Tax=Gordonia liuliyuniae TaxID=2911517 RepID=UPI001F02A3C1|nr:TIGR03564 family F420-dependent LLM class oxidoreductase [Gordonia liuliyuniae]MCF8608683.1 TIGR03564 family F420-dependent LLM class oxidoreductase [Gordonia liuliyuniae]